MSKGLAYLYEPKSKSYIVVGIGTCKDTDLVIPSIYRGKPVTSIGDSAFFYCESLTSIRFNGTVDEWNAISKGDDWNGIVPATKIVCSNGEVTL